VAWTRAVEIVDPGNYCSQSKQFFIDSVLPRKDDLFSHS